MRYPFAESKYNIKKGYRHRPKTDKFDDTSNEDEWQKEVYEYASQLLTNTQGETVIDLGCGSAYKLLKHFNGIFTLGVEIEPTLSWLKKKYPHRSWISWNNIPKTSVDLVICSDVIEHIKDPSEFLKEIAKIDFKYLILSTPERNSKRGQLDFGPPENVFHYREWSKKEFRSFVSKYFEVKEHFISNKTQCTQLILCTNRS